MKRTIVIGDVHGCYQELQILLKKTNYNPVVDRLIFVGDVINRGPDSLKVLELIRTQNAEVVQGNHEYFFLKEGVTNCRPSKFPKIRKEMGDHLSYWQSWMEGLPYFIENEDFLVVHAGIVPGEHPSQSDPKALVTIRTWDKIGKELNSPQNSAWFSYYKNPKLVIFGHWASLGLVIRENVIGLDSGCVYGKKLTAVILPEKRIFQVNAEKTYVHPNV